MKAEEIIENICLKNNTQPIYKGKTTKDIVLQSMKEYAKQKCVEQRFICQIEFDKRAIFRDNDCYLHSEDVLNAPEPEFD
jgi:hypothetical protein